MRGSAVSEIGLSGMTFAAEGVVEFTRNEHQVSFKARTRTVGPGRVGQYCMIQKKEKKRKEKGVGGRSRMNSVKLEAGGEKSG